VPEVTEDVAQARLDRGEFAFGDVGGAHQLHGWRLAAPQEGRDLVLEPARAGERLIPQPEKRPPFLFPLLPQQPSPTSGRHHCGGDSRGDVHRNGVTNKGHTLEIPLMRCGGGTYAQASIWRIRTMDEIEIVDYDPNWPEMFVEEAARLRRTLDPGLLVASA
jgi:hypothetical protein